jgi:GDP-mannose 6-dehydrogenase
MDVRISIFGLGYVGSVSAACLAKDGHTAIGVDVNPQKMALLAAGCAPVLESGLAELVGEAVQSGRLRVCPDGQAAVHDSDVSLICVGTPSNGNGSLNLDYVENVCDEIGKALATKSGYHVVAIRSTVLPGTVQERLIPLLEDRSGKRAGRHFGVCMNPEFLREGSAIRDYYQPSQIVIGEFDKSSGDVFQDLYAAVDAPIVRTTIQAAEMLKYACNAFHAVKISFANEIGNLCLAHGIDGQQLMTLFCQDRQLNISPTYLKPGFAFGGSCLGKDLRALLHRAKEQDLVVPLLSAVLESNQRQIQRGIWLVEQTGRKRIGVLGLSFKAGTDDVRESPSVPLVEMLIGRGYQVCIYDEHVKPERLIGMNKAYLERELPHIASLMRSSIEEVVAMAEVVVIANGTAAFSRVPGLLRADQILIDLVGAHQGLSAGRAELSRNRRVASQPAPQRVRSDQEAHQRDIEQHPAQRSRD